MGRRKGREQPFNGFKLLSLSVCFLGIRAWRGKLICQRHIGEMESLVNRRYCFGVAPAQLHQRRIHDNAREPSRKPGTTLEPVPMART